MASHADETSAIAWAFGDPGRLGPWSDEAVATVWLGRTGPAPAAATSPTEADRRDARAHAPVRQPGFLLRRSTMRACIARWLALPAEGVVVAYDAQRRPRLHAPARSLFVSGASRGEWQAVALARNPVGVDLEPVTGAADEPAWAMLATHERLRLAALPRERQADAFLALWTAKEAALKALGTGLAREPAEIAVEPLAGGRLALSDRGRPMRLRAAESRSAELGGTTVQAACVVLGP